MHADHQAAVGVFEHTHISAGQMQRTSISDVPRGTLSENRDTHQFAQSVKREGAARCMANTLRFVQTARRGAWTQVTSSIPNAYSR